MGEPSFKEPVDNSCQVPLISSEEIDSEQASTLIENIWPEAARRCSGHEATLQRVCSLAKQEAQDHGLPLSKIEVRPAWSHEYEEHTAIVVAIETQATSDERFSYWDAVCERLNELADSLSPSDQRFLNEDLSFLVSRS